MESVQSQKKVFIAKCFIIVLFILASLIRILFINNKSIFDYQYDVGVIKIDSNNAYEKIYAQDREYLKPWRHLDYIMTIYNTGKLPDTNKVQQYHPPLHHLICVGWLKLLDNFTFSAEQKLESLQILTCIYSIVAMFIILKICNELKLNSFYKIIVLLFVGFNPMFIIMSGFLSNDMLVSMFILLCFYLIIKWRQKSSYKNTILLSLVFGLGCATKTSMLVMGMIIAAIVITKWIISLLSRKNTSVEKPIYSTKTFLLQTLIFLIIATPLSMAYPYRNYKMFNQPFIYVVKPKESLIIEERNIFKRYFPFSTEIFEDELHEDNINVFSYAIKSNIIFSLRTSIHYFTLLKFLSIILYTFALIAMLYLFAKESNLYVKLLIITCLIWLISFISFNVNYPASCTMHAKYIYCYIALLPIVSTYFLQKKDSYTMSMVIYTLTTIYAVFSSLGIILLF